MKIYLCNVRQNRTDAELVVFQSCVLRVCTSRLIKTCISILHGLHLIEIKDTALFQADIKYLIGGQLFDFLLQLICL